MYKVQSIDHLFFIHFSTTIEKLIATPPAPVASGKVCRSTNFLISQGKNELAKIIEKHIDLSFAFELQN